MDMCYGSYSQVSQWMMKKLQAGDHTDFQPASLFRCYGTRLCRSLQSFPGGHTGLNAQASISSPSCCGPVSLAWLHGRLPGGAAYLGAPICMPYRAKAHFRYEQQLSKLYRNHHIFRSTDS